MGFKMKRIWKHDNADIASHSVIAIIRQFHTEVHLSGPKVYWIQKLSLIALNFLQ